MMTSPKGACRALEILDFVARARFAPSSRQIFAQLDLPRSTGYDLLSGLAQRAFLRRHPTGHWSLGDEMYALALSRLGLGTAAAEIDSVLTALQEETQETAQLAVLHNGKALITHAFTSSRSMSALIHVGSRVPINWTAAGRLLVSDLSDSLLKEFFRTHARASANGRAVMSGRIFRRQVGDARRRGYAIELEQAQRGGCSVAAPVFDPSGRCVAAINLVLPAARLLGSRDTLVALVCAAATRLK